MVANVHFVVQFHIGSAQTIGYVHSSLDICRLYLHYRYKDNHFYSRKLAELTRCFMETSPELPILRALTNYYEDSWLLNVNK